MITYVIGAELYIPPYLRNKEGVVLVVLGFQGDHVKAVNKIYLNSPGGESMHILIDPNTNTTLGYAQRVYSSKEDFESQMMLKNIGTN